VVAVVVEESSSRCDSCPHQCVRYQRRDLRKPDKQSPLRLFGRVVWLGSTGRLDSQPNHPRPE